MLNFMRLLLRAAALASVIVATAAVADEALPLRVNVFPGAQNLLSLRAEIEGQWDGKAPAPDKYFDMQYHERALKALGR